jgi:hypothetical protein
LANQHDPAQNWTTGNRARLHLRAFSAPAERIDMLLQLRLSL